MKKIRIGIVGTGGMANGHADAFKAIPGVTLAACLDVVPGRGEAFAAKHGIAKVATDLDGLLADVDAVSVAVLVGPYFLAGATAVAELEQGQFGAG